MNEPRIKVIDFKHSKYVILEISEFRLEITPGRTGWNLTWRRTDSPTNVPNLGHLALTNPELRAVFGIGLFPFNQAIPANPTEEVGGVFRRDGQQLTITFGPNIPAVQGEITNTVLVNVQQIIDDMYVLDTDEPRPV